MASSTEGSEAPFARAAESRASSRCRRSASTVNPAGRLHRLLTAARKIQPNTRTTDAWRQLLDSPGLDDTQLLSRFGLALRLPQEARDALDAVADLNRDLFLRWVARVDVAFFHNRFDATINQFTEHLDDATLTTIEHGSDLLSKRFAQNPAIEQHLPSISRAVKELRQDVVESDLPADIIEFVLDHLRAIDEALETYTIRGAEGLRDAAHRAVGAIVCDKSIDTKAGGSRVWQRAKHLFVGIAAVVRLGADAAKIAEAVGLLEAPPAITELESQSDWSSPTLTARF